LTALEAIVAVLTEAGESLDCRTITQRILDHHICSTTVRVPKQSIHAVLVVDIKKWGAASRFQRTAPGMFALRAWGLPEVASRAKGPGKVADDPIVAAPTDRIWYLCWICTHRYTVHLARPGQAIVHGRSLRHPEAVEAVRTIPVGGRLAAQPAAGKGTS